MTTRTHRIAIVASFLVVTLMMTSAVSAYVLLSPARRWFSTPKAITWVSWTRARPRGSCMGGSSWQRARRSPSA